MGGVVAVLGHNPSGVQTHEMSTSTDPFSQSAVASSSSSSSH